MIYCKGGIKRCEANLPKILEMTLVMVGLNINYSLQNKLIPFPVHVIYFVENGIKSVLYNIL
jgi:hypothetical protein